MYLYLYPDAFEKYLYLYLDAFSEMANPDRIKKKIHYTLSKLSKMSKHAHKDLVYFYLLTRPRSSAFIDSSKFGTCVGWGVGTRTTFWRTTTLPLGGAGKVAGPGAAVVYTYSVLEVVMGSVVPVAALSPESIRNSHECC